MEIIKYKKKHKKKKIINISRQFLGSLQFGYYGIKALSYGVLDSKQIEIVRRMFVKITKRVGKVFIRVFFNHPLTAKSLLSRMGKGVGSIKFWISYIKKGIIFLEITGITKKLAVKAFNKIKCKLPIKVNLCSREVFGTKKIA